MPKEYLEAAIAASKVSLLPQEVKNLLALNSLQARWATVHVGNPAVQTMGFRIYHNMQLMRFSGRYVCLKADQAYTLANWLDAVHRWEQLYGS
jgi:hypothetical protein